MCCNLFGWICCLGSLGHLKRRWAITSWGWVPVCFKKGLEIRVILHLLCGYQWTTILRWNHGIFCHSVSKSGFLAGSRGGSLVRSGMTLKISIPRVATFRTTGRLQKLHGLKAIRKGGMSLHQKEFILSRGVSKVIGRLQMAGTTNHPKVESIGIPKLGIRIRYKTYQYRVLSLPCVWNMSPFVTASGAWLSQNNYLAFVDFSKFIPNNCE